MLQFLKNIANIQLHITCNTIRLQEKILNIYYAD